MSTAALLPPVTLLVVYLPPAVVLAWIDGREHRLPNRWVGVLSALVVAALALVALVEPALRSQVGTALVLGLVAGVAAVLMALLAPSLLGMGDAKTVPVVVAMSAVLGGQVLIAALLGVAVLGGLIGAVVLAVSRRPGARFAFGPVLLAGPFLGLLGAPLVARALGAG